MNQKPMKTKHSKLQIGQNIERSIEGMWFLAEIILIKGNYINIKYLDDSNIENNVSIDEIRINISNQELKYNEIIYQDTLKKPLYGLIDDDSIERYNKIPTITIHDSNEHGEAIIINGAVNRLAAGPGLKALRYLKN